LECKSQRTQTFLDYTKPNRDSNARDLPAFDNYPLISYLQPPVTETEVEKIWFDRQTEDLSVIFLRK